MGDVTDENRDAQRSAVYRCEDQYAQMCARANPATGPVLTELAGSQVLLPAERRFGRIEDVVSYLEALRASTRHLFPGMPAVTVRARKGTHRAHWEPPGTIAIPVSGVMLREHVVLHEYAHHVTFHLGRQGPAHGPQFRAVLCQLHTAATGDTGGWALAVLFDSSLRTAA